MFRILLADDEGTMLESLKYIIAISFGGECDIRCVKVGRAVMEMAEGSHPDIAFVDIHMSGFSGVQAIQGIRKVNNEMIIIIIMAYDKPAHAKEAVSLGVMEYLTKPISNKKVILDVHMRAMQRVGEARQKQDDGPKIRERLEIAVPMIESGFIYSMLQNDGAADSSGYEELLGIRNNHGFCLVLEFGDGDGSDRLTNAIGSSVKANKHYQDIREIAKDYLSCITEPVMGDRVVLPVPSSGLILKYEEWMEVITRIKTTLQKLEKHIGNDLRSGIGGTKTLGNAKESYGKVPRALRESVSYVVHITDIPSRQGDVAGGYSKELESSYYEWGLKTDSEGAAACGTELFSCVEGMYGCREDVEAKILELTTWLEYRICAKDGTGFGMKPRDSYIRGIGDAPDSDKLCHWFLEKTRGICKYAGTEKKKGMEYLVNTVGKYVDENYQKDISLGEIPGTVNISSYYFSKLFKQGIGENFIEYLTRTRMRQACVCLQNPGYSIKQICVMVGYSDPNHFSRIFKKYEGANPSEYRERLENGTGREQGVDMSICKKGTVGRIVYTLSAVLFTVLAASGCVRMEDAAAGNMEQEGPKIQIGLSFDSFVIERWIREWDVFVSTAKELRAEVNVQSVDGGVQDQISQTEYFIRKQVDVIVVVVGDYEAPTDMMIKARGAGIKTVPYGRLIQNVGCDLYMSFDNTEMGRLMARSLLENISDGGDTFLIQGPLTDHNVTLVREGTDEMLAGSSPSVAYKPNCAGWAAENAYTYTKEGLKQDRYVRGIICGNDDLADQAFRALSEERLVGKVYVAGQDGDLAACQRTVEGTQEMAVFKSVEQEASMTARYAVLLGLGEEIEEARSTAYDGTYQVLYLELQPIAVTGENMDEAIIKSGFHTKEDVCLNVSRPSCQ